MNILVTGAKGFVGKNLCVSLKNIKDGKDRARPELKIEEVFEYDIDTDPALLACLQSPQSVCTFRSSTWKQETVARMSAFPKKPTAVLLTLYPMSTSHIPSTQDATSTSADFPKREPM